MQMQTWLKRLVVSISTILSTGAITGCIEEEKTAPGIEESSYAVPFPLQQGGEQIDVLVRVRDSLRPYHLNLVFAEQRDWSQEQKDQLRRLFDGFVTGDANVLPFPIKLRIRIDPVDGRSDIHVDQVVSERHPHYGRYVENDTVIWRALKFYSQSFTPGIYRVRVDNLAPVPQIDFQTFFEFERDNRKY